MLLLLLSQPNMARQKMKKRGERNHSQECDASVDVATAHRHVSDMFVAAAHHPSLLRTRRSHTKIHTKHCKLHLINKTK